MAKATSLVKSGKNLFKKFPGLGAKISAVLVACELITLALKFLRECSVASKQDDEQEEEEEEDEKGETGELPSLDDLIFDCVCVVGDLSSGKQIAVKQQDVGKEFGELLEKRISEVDDENRDFEWWFPFDMN